MSDITYNQRVAFKNDWNVGKFKISASTRAIIAAVLLGISGILAILTIVLLFVVDENIVGYVMYLITLIPSLISYLLGSNFQIKSCCDTPQLLIGIIFHCVCVGSVSMSLLGNGVNETTVIILIIQMAYIYTSIITLPFIKRYFDELVSWIIN
ncbi:Transmembrane protein [Entamoeba marina]